jgi:hypothetical protein
MDCFLFGLVGGQEESKDQSQWVHFDSTSKLQYKQTPRGDQILDFSYADYMGGGVALPRVAAKLTVAPGAADDTAALQKAIETVSQMPIVDGFRGAVVLELGTFHCDKPL